MYSKEKRFLHLMHMGLDPGKEVGDLGEDSGHSLANAGSPGHDTDNVELAGFGLRGAHERATRVTHACGAAVGTESDHARLDHILPTALQVRIRPDLALELLKRVWHVPWGVDETPTREPAAFGAAVVVAGVRHAGGTGIRPGEVHVRGKFDQGDVVLDWVGLVELRVDDDLRHGDVFFGAIVVLLMPFSDADTELGGVLGRTEAVSGAKDPARGDQCTSANVLFLEKGVGRESEGDLPGELSVAGGQSVDDTTVAAFFPASGEGGGGSHQRDQHDQHLHLRGWIRR